MASRKYADLDYVVEAILNRTGEGLNDEEFAELVDRIYTDINKHGGSGPWSSVGEWIDACYEEIINNQ